MPQNTEQSLRHELTKLSHDAPPKLASFALWIAGHLDTVAFQSIRGLADAAGVNANLVPRLAQSIGYAGFDEFRADVQRIIQNRANSYGSRARELRSRSTGIYDELIDASRHNFQNATTPDQLAGIQACVALLTSAQRVYTIGVRSCFSIAHYFSYVGSMAFDTFVEVPTLPGAILDQMSQTKPGDVIVAITFDHYSAEVVRACQIAQMRGAQVIALTDHAHSPIAASAKQTILLPMAGPQLVPSLATAFLTVDIILSAMASTSETAAERIEAYENRIAEFGGYSPQASKM